MELKRTKKTEIKLTNEHRMKMLANFVIDRFLADLKADKIAIKLDNKAKIINH